MRVVIVLLSFALLVSSGAGRAMASPQDELCAAAKTAGPADIAAALKKGAKVDAMCGNFAEPALDVANTVARLDNMEALIKAGAKVSRAGHPALNYARTAAVADMLLRHGARVNGKDDIGNSPLYNVTSNLSSNFGDFYQMTEQDAVEISTVLIAHGANVNFSTKYGGTPLMEATFSCLPKLTTLLIGKGGKVNIRSAGQTPLGRLENIKDMHPTECGETEAILLAHGAVQ